MEVPEQNYNDLATALRASENHNLSLSAAADFEQVDPSSFEDVKLGSGGASIFLSHITHRLACDPRSRGLGRGRIGSYDTIHRFNVAPALSGPLNERLRELALNKESDAREIAEGARDGLSASVSLSNWGGYQSHHQIFDGFENDPVARDTYSSCRELHGIASAAMDELLGPIDGGALGAAALHPLYGWLNVNRSSDLNFMHVHAPDRYTSLNFPTSLLLTSLTS